MEYARRVTVASMTEAENAVTALRWDLGSKSGLTDGLDQPDAYWEAFGQVVVASKVAGNWLVALRRPELVHIALRNSG